MDYGSAKVIAADWGADNGPHPAGNGSTIRSKSDLDPNPVGDPGTNPDVFSERRGELHPSVIKRFKFDHVLNLKTHPFEVSSGTTHAVRAAHSHAEDIE